LSGVNRVVIENLPKNYIFSPPRKPPQSALARLNLNGHNALMKTEYKVVPAPERARKKRGLKGPALFAHEVETVMNELAADGWQYLRTDTLPHEERSGLTNKVTTYRNLLVFQRVLVEDAANPAPEAPAVPVVPIVPETDQTPPPEAPLPDAQDEGEVTNLWQALDIEAETSEADAAPSGPRRQR
jgi:hypothetical protein